MEQLNYNEHIKQKEFYTGLKGFKINDDIEYLLQQMKLC
jgi:hypothetical protein